MLHAADVKRRRFTVEEYHRMAEAGILTEDDRVELIEGEIIEKSPVTTRHSSCVNRLSELFVERVNRRAHVSVHNPVQLTEYSEPEPDLALLKRRADYYVDTTPTPADVLLLVEVADSSITRDRHQKLPQYARSGIVEAWLVNLETDQIEIYRQPTATGYADTQTVQPGERLAPHCFPDMLLRVADILGTPNQ